jgi:DNA-binding PadR family transcriptional regulator
MRKDFRKYQVLEFLDRGGEATAREIYDGISPPSKLHTLTTHLNRYWKNGLLEKRHLKGKTLYSLTRKGLERLNYFRRVKFKDIQPLNL